MFQIFSLPFPFIDLELTKSPTIELPYAFISYQIYYSIISHVKRAWNDAHFCKVNEGKICNFKTTSTNQTHSCAAFLAESLRVLW